MAGARREAWRGNPCIPVFWDDAGCRSEVLHMNRMKLEPTIDPEGAIPSDPLFIWRRLLVEYHVEGDDVALHIDPKDGTTIHGILSLLGFDETNCAIEGCHFYLNEDLPLGTFKLRPLATDAKGSPDA